MGRGEVDAGRFVAAAAEVSGKRLSYAELTGNVGDTGEGWLSSGLVAEVVPA